MIPIYLFRLIAAHLVAQQLEPLHEPEAAIWEFLGMPYVRGFLVTGTSWYQPQPDAWRYLRRQRFAAGPGRPQATRAHLLAAVVCRRRRGQPPRAREPFPRSRDPRPRPLLVAAVPALGRGGRRVQLSRALTRDAADRRLPRSFHLHGGKHVAWATRHV